MKDPFWVIEVYLPRGVSFYTVAYEGDGEFPIHYSTREEAGCMAAILNEYSRTPVSLAMVIEAHVKKQRGPVNG